MLGMAILAALPDGISKDSGIEPEILTRRARPAQLRRRA
jgi:hypothetical protein